MTTALAIIGILLALVLGAFVTNRPPLLEPPGPWFRLRTYLGSNLAETSTTGPFPELRPRSYALPPDEVHHAAVGSITDLGWELRSSDINSLNIEAIVTTRLFSFKDDLAIRIEARGPISIVYCTSRSRIGRGDFGANARHIIDLFERLDARLANAQGEQPKP